MESKNITSLIVTHNARIRCLIMKLFSNSNVSSEQNTRNNFKHFRLQNCCVLELRLKPNIRDDYKPIHFNLSLIYDGEIDVSENKQSYQYWANNQTNNVSSIPISTRYNAFKPLEGDIYFSDLSDLNMKSGLNIDTPFTFYLVRHGQAEHNLYTKTTILRKIDTSLTVSGKNQAINAGKALNEYLKSKSQLLNYFFVSDLIRTRQTLGGILGNISINYLTLNTRANKLNLVVLPCSHELAFDSSGKCDSSINIAQAVTSENKISCTTNDKKRSKMNDCMTFAIFNVSENTNINVELDWTFYSNFYGQSYRGDTMSKISGIKQQCRNTSMVEQSILYIKSIKNVNLVAGRNNRNKTRKNRNKTRKNRNKTRKNRNI